MEEDKKEESIEQITKILEQHLKNSEIMFEKFGTLAFEYADIKRISKILIRYKEQKEIEQIHRQENGELREQVKELEEDLTSVYLKGVYDERDKWIALVEEEIEKLKQEGNYKTLENPNGRVHFHAEPCDYKIQVLQELLEKRK